MFDPVLWPALVLVTPLVSLTATHAWRFARAARAERSVRGCAGDYESLPPAAYVRLLALEVLGTLAAWCAPPFPTQSDRPGRDGRRPLVLVPGFGLPARSLALLARRLRRDGWAAVVPASRGFPWIGPQERKEGLATAIREAQRWSGSRAVDLLAFGAGGLVARMLLGDRAVAADVRRVLTLATPHQGSAHGCLRPDSPWLVGLGAIGAAGAEIVSIYSPEDGAIFPARQAYLAGAFNVEVRGIGHLGFLVSRHAYDLVRENLAEDIVRA